MTPEEALVLLWHRTQTGSHDVPAWAKAHPEWPANRPDAEGYGRSGHLRKAAPPLVREMEERIRARDPAAGAPL